MDGWMDDNGRVLPSCTVLTNYIEGKHRDWYIISNREENETGIFEYWLFVSLYIMYIYYIYFNQLPCSAITNLKFLLTIEEVMNLRNTMYKLAGKEMKSSGG